MIFFSKKFCIRPDLWTNKINFLLFFGSVSYKSKFHQNKYQKNSNNVEQIYHYIQIIIPYIEIAKIVERISFV